MCKNLRTEKSFAIAIELPYVNFECIISEISKVAILLQYFFLKEKKTHCLILCVVWKKVKSALWKIIDCPFLFITYGVHFVEIFNTKNYLCLAEIKQVLYQHFNYASCYLYTTLCVSILFHIDMFCHTCIIAYPWMYSAKHMYDYCMFLIFTCNTARNLVTCYGINLDVSYIVWLPTWWTSPIELETIRYLVHSISIVQPDFFQIFQCVCIKYLMVTSTRWTSPIKPGTECYSVYIISCGKSGIYQSHLRVYYNAIHLLF